MVAYNPDLIRDQNNLLEKSVRSKVLLKINYCNRDTKLQY